jgi:S1-C subfamily serine protease
MKRLSTIVVAAALVAGLGGAAIAFALGASGETPPHARGNTVAEPFSRTPDPAALTPEAIYKDTSPGVVTISAAQTVTLPATPFGPPTSGKVQVGGSGFVIDRKGDILTNEHVVQNASDVRVGFSGGASYPAKVVGIDATTDLAVIRVEATGSALHPLVLADSGHVEVGDSVYAIGNPFGLDRTMTAGIVSATGRDIQAPNGLGIPNAIQTDAPINHGNSGGPLLDVFGRVVGINDQIDSGGTVDGNVGIGFAIASNTAKAIVPQLLAHGRAPHAWLGIDVAPINAAISKVVHGLPDHGALIVRVVPGSPAARAGLEAGTKPVTVDGESLLVGGDAIVAVDGKSIDTPEELANAVRSHAPSDELRMQVTRSGRERTVAVKLGNAPGAP